MDLLIFDWMTVNFACSRTPIVSLSCRIDFIELSYLTMPDGQAALPADFAVFQKKLENLKAFIVSLPPSKIPLGTATGHIVKVLQGHPTPPIVSNDDKDQQWEPFCNRMNALMGSGMVNENGEFLHLKRGKHGIQQVYDYLQNLEKACPKGIIWGQAAIKITQLLRALKKYVLGRSI